MHNHITIYLLRHGETRGNIKKITQGQARIRLNKTGIKQAKKAAKFLKKKALSAIYCSPLMRTMQTAKIILKNHSHAKFVKMPELSERHAGCLQGLNRKQIFKLIPDIQKQWKSEGVDWHPPEGGESIRELYERAHTGFKRILKQHKLGDNILIITHGGIIKCLLNKFQKRRLKDIFCIKNPANCEITEILWNNKPLRIRCLLK